MRFASLEVRPAPLREARVVGLRRAGGFLCSETTLNGGGCGVKRGGQIRYRSVTYGGCLAAKVQVSALCARSNRTRDTPECVVNCA